MMSSNWGPQEDSEKLQREEVRKGEEKQGQPGRLLFPPVTVRPRDWEYYLEASRRTEP